MEPEGSLPSSQNPATGPCPEPRMSIRGAVFLHLRNVVLRQKDIFILSDDTARNDCPVTVIMLSIERHR
jgi:hypothetical protein